MAQYDYPVGHPEHLVDVVRNQYDGRPLLTEGRNEPLYLGALADTKREGGLVQDQQPGPVQHGPGHRQELAHPPGQVTHAGGGVGQRDAEALQESDRLLVQRSVVEEQPPPLTAQEEVGSHVQVVAQLGVLADDGDAAPIGGPGPRRYRSPVQEDLADCRGDVAGHAAHQGCLAGTVLSRQGDQLPGRYLEVDSVERPQGTETNAETLDRKQDPRHWGHKRALRR